MDTIKAGKIFAVESRDKFGKITQSEERFEALVDFSISQLQADYFLTHPEQKKYDDWDVFVFMDWLVERQIARCLKSVIFVVNEDEEVTFSLEREDDTLPDATAILSAELKAENNRLKLSLV